MRGGPEAPEPKPFDHAASIELAGRLRGAWRRPPIGQRTNPDHDLFLEAACRIEAQSALIETLRTALDSIDDILDLVDAQVANVRHGAEQLADRNVSLLAENAALVLETGAVPNGARA